MNSSTTRLLLPFFFLLLAAVPARAQPEVEPNNTQVTANHMPYAGTITGQVSCVAGDNDDYFRVVMPTGTKSLRLITKSKMQSGTGGSMYYYLYNKYGGQLTNYYQSGLTTAWFTDTLDYPCFEGDTFFVRAYNWSGGCKDYEITTGTPAVFQAGADPEVNDDFASATPLAFNFDTSGHLANMRYGAAAALTDLNDYYRVVPPTGNKGLRLITRWRSATPGSNGSAYTYLYNKFQQQLDVKYRTFGDAWVTDTLDYPCFEGDTFYVRMYDWSGNCKEYRMRATTPGVYTVSNDVENNDNFASAVPIPWATDSSGHLASQRYSATTSYTDLNDYYRIVPPAANRSLRLISKWRSAAPGSSGSAYTYLYNKFQQQLTVKYRTFTDAWTTDTLDYPCFEGDTFYVRMYDWSGNCKEYEFNAGSANSFLAGDDPEVNDNFTTATPLAFNADTSGHLASQRYGATTSYTDLNDYYRIIAPPGNRSVRLISQWRSATPGSNGSAYSYIYNKSQQQLTVKYRTFTDAWTTDTLDYPCFEGDTFYVRMYDWSGNCKEYRLRTTTTGYFGFAGDTESNNTLATATALAFRTSTTGTLATQVYTPGSIYTDLNDYYRVVMPNNDRGIRAIINARMPTPGASGTFYLYLYNKAGSQLAVKYISASNTLKADTLEFPCFNSDTFYVRIYDWSGDCKEYSLRTEYSTNGPIHSAFERTRFGSSFSFVNRSRNATSYLWTFGDGVTDTTAYPVHTYGIGQFPIRLRATGFCGAMDSRDTVQVDGIEYYAPHAAGTVDGYGVFNVRFFGAGFDTLAVVTLKKGGTTLLPTRKASPSTKELNLMYNLRGVDTGVYDVQVQLSGGQTFSYPGGFQIFQEEPGASVSTKLTGPARVRTGVWTNYSLVVKNNKAKMANGAIVFIALPRGTETNIKSMLRKRTGSLHISGDDYNKLTIDRDFYNEVYYGGEFNPATDVIDVDYDDLYSAFDTMVHIRMDSLLGEPFDGTLYPLYIPMIAGNGTWSLNFKMRAGANGKYQAVSFAWPFTARQNPVSGETLDYIHTAGLTAASAAELSPHPALKVVGKTAGYVDIASQTAFAEAFDWWYGTNVADEDFYARQATALAGEVAGDKIPFGGRTETALEQVERSKLLIKNRTKNRRIAEEMSHWSNDPAVKNHYKRQFQLLSDRIRDAEGKLTASQREALRNGMLHVLAKAGVNITAEELGDYLFPDDIDRQPWESLTSFDPNAIYGNSGPKAEQYLRRADILSYLITFENVDTALAPAAIVRVETQLDTNKFDLRRAYLGNVTIGDKVYLVEQDRREYFRDIDLRPAKNLIVRVNAHMDSTGRAYWEFTSLDPATMDIPQDPTIGFLPPNVTSPEGEGSVSFYAQLKPGVQNRDSFSAQAKIFFDANEPIETNKWHNTVDEGIPSTTVSPTILLTDDSVMHLTLAGDDAESGLEQYAVFMKADTAWEPLPYYFSAGEDARITGIPGHTYSFYAVAKDSVGNKQSKPQTAEATITIPVRETTLPPIAEGLSIYPNPTRSTVNLALNVADEGPLTLTFTTAAGSRALEWNTEHPGGPARYTVVLGSLAPGVYFVKAAVGAKMVGEARLVVVP